MPALVQLVIETASSVDRRRVFPALKTALERCGAMELSSHATDGPARSFKLGPAALPVLLAALALREIERKAAFAAAGDSEQGGSATGNESSTDLPHSIPHAPAVPLPAVPVERIDTGQDEDEDEDDGGQEDSLRSRWRWYPLSQTLGALCAILSVPWAEALAQSGGAVLREAGLEDVAESESKPRLRPGSSLESMVRLLPARALPGACKAVAPPPSSS